MNSTKLINFLGSLLVVGIAIGIFMMLMSTEMPESNRELLIAFVSVLFGAMSGSLRNITGDESQTVKELQGENQKLLDQIQKLKGDEST